MADGKENIIKNAFSDAKNNGEIASNLCVFIDEDQKANSLNPADRKVLLDFIQKVIKPKSNENEFNQALDGFCEKLDIGRGQLGNLYDEYVSKDKVKFSKGEQEEFKEFADDFMKRPKVEIDREYIGKEELGLVGIPDLTDIYEGFPEIAGNLPDFKKLAYLSPEDLNKEQAQSSKDEDKGLDALFLKVDEEIRKHKELDSENIIPELDNLSQAPDSLSKVSGIMKKLKGAGMKISDSNIQKVENRNINPIAGKKTGKDNDKSK